MSACSARLEVYDNAQRLYTCTGATRELHKLCSTHADKNNSLLLQMFASLRARKSARSNPSLDKTMNGARLLKSQVCCCMLRCDTEACEYSSHIWCSHQVLLRTPVDLRMSHAGCFMVLAQICTHWQCGADEVQLVYHIKCI